MAEILKGKPVADAMNEELAPRIEALKAAGITPTLAIIRVGERDDDLSYERGATKRCETLGLGLKKFVLDAGTRNRGWTLVKDEEGLKLKNVSFKLIIR